MSLDRELTALDIALSVTDRVRPKLEEIYEHTHFDDNNEDKWVLQKRVDELSSGLLEVCSALQIVIDDARSKERVIGVIMWTKYDIGQELYRVSFSDSGNHTLGKFVVYSSLIQGEGIFYKDGEHGSWNNERVLFPTIRDAIAGLTTMIYEHHVKHLYRVRELELHSTMEEKHAD